MNSFYWLLVSIVSSIADGIDVVAYKRVSEITEKHRVPKFFLILLDDITIVGFFVIMAIFAFGREAWMGFFTTATTVYGFFAFLLFMVLRKIHVITWIHAYANEKVSVLSPYSQLWPVLSIITGYLFFPGSTDPRTFICALVASLVLAVSDIEGGKIRFNKYCLALVVSNLIDVGILMLSVKLAESLSPLSITLGHVFFGFVVLSLYFLFRKKDRVFPNDPVDTKAFWINFSISNGTWLFNTVISLVLFQTVGVTMTILLSMVTLVASIVCAYFFFHDVPSKKSIVVSVIILFCIALGMYFSPSLDI